MIKQITTVAAVGTLLSACSATNPFNSANTANVNVKPPIGVVKSMYEHQSAKVQQQVEQVPSWYTKMPVKDDAIYAVGTANTPDLQLSNDIAILSA